MVKDVSGHVHECSCFANAALQCLVATRPMCAYLCSGLHSSRGCPAPAGAFCPLCQLESLARGMRDGDRPANAQPFISHVRLLCRDMIVGEQVPPIRGLTCASVICCLICPGWLEKMHPSD